MGMTKKGDWKSLVKPQMKQSEAEIPEKHSHLRLRFCFHRFFTWLVCLSFWGRKKSVRGIAVSISMTRLMLAVLIRQKIQRPFLILSLSLVFFLASFLGILSAEAVDVEVLPAGIRMTQAKFGVISGLDQTWKNDGKLYDLGESRSVTFDAATLARVNAQARALVQALDSFGSHDLGRKLSLGTLNVSTTPQVTYIAPVLAYGVTDRFTIGIGLPVVRYQNQISLSASASNLDFFRQQLGGLSKKVDEALNIDLVTESKRVIAEKGYRPLQSRDETFIGDMQVALLYRFPDLGTWAVLNQMTLTLPTGPKDDPNDLASLNAFGMASIDESLILAHALTPRWTILPYASLAVPIPDRTWKRVPKDENDTLPDPTSLQEVGRWLGPSTSLGFELRWEVVHRWTLKAGNEFITKWQDRYNGSGRVDLLGNNTDSSVLRARGGLTFSTVEDYKLRKASVPTRVSLEVSDTVVGRNIERQLRTDLTAMLFF
jgi:hypothetical protein